MHSIYKLLSSHTLNKVDKNNVKIIYDSISSGKFLDSDIAQVYYFYGVWLFQENQKEIGINYFLKARSKGCPKSIHYIYEYCTEKQNYLLITDNFANDINSQFIKLVYYIEHMPESATELFAEFIKIATYTFLIETAHYYLNKNDIKKAEILLEVAFKKNFKNETFILAGLINIKKENYQKAIEMFNMDHENHNSLYYIAVCHMRLNNHEMARKKFIEGAEKGVPNSQYALAELIRTIDNDSEKSLIYYEMAADNNHALACKYLSDYYIRTMPISEKASKYTILAAKKNFTDCYFNAAVYSYQKNDFNAAHKYFMGIAYLHRINHINFSKIDGYYLKTETNPKNALEYYNASQYYNHSPERKRAFEKKIYELLYQCRIENPNCKMIEI